MSLGNLNFEDITENDLKVLIDAGVPEGLTIEYKRDCYGNSDRAGTSGSKLKNTLHRNSARGTA